MIQSSDLLCAALCFPSLFCSLLPAFSALFSVPSLLSSLCLLCSLLPPFSALFSVPSLLSSLPSLLSSPFSPCSQPYLDTEQPEIDYETGKVIADNNGNRTLISPLLQKPPAVRSLSTCCYRSMRLVCVFAIVCACSVFRSSVSFPYPGPVLYFLQTEEEAEKRSLADPAIYHVSQ